MTQATSIKPCGLIPITGFGVTERRDAWWIGPTVTAIGLGLFIVYATFRAFYAIWFQTYHVGPGTGVLEDHAYLLSPFFSPLIVWDGMPAWISPAFLILWAPGGFRVTCYYYRKAYYRAFFADPMGCAVGEPGHFCGFSRNKCSYEGETRLWLFQNLHRFFLYIAILFIVLLAIDVVHSMYWPGSGFGISVGTLVLAANVVCLSMYTFGCHSLRHLVGGAVDSFSRVAFGKARYGLWRGVSKLNEHHMFWAWTSLFMVAFADLYVWMVAAGVINDIRIL